MYQVYADDYLLYSDQINNLKIISPKLQLEVNKICYFDFEIYPNHAYYNMINKLKSIIKVYQDDDLIFRGRAISDEKSFKNQKLIECESDYAFLNDSIQRPFTFTGDIDEFLEFLIINHNSQVSEDKQFTLGNVTVTDDNGYLARSSINPLKTLDIIQDKLINIYGGYLWIRHENNINYVDYLEDFNILSSQSIDLNSNLLDLKIIVDTENFATHLIPYGAKLLDDEEKETDVRLDITSVNDNVDYVYNTEAAAAYGEIWTSNTWEDVTEASNLLTKAQNYLNELILLATTFEISAADLATVNNTISSYRLGTYVQVTSDIHNIDDSFLIKKLDVNLLNPVENKITVGSTVKNFTDKTKDMDKLENNLVNRIETVSNNARDIIYSLDNRISSSIDQSAENILLSVSDSFYLKEETDSLISEVSTSLEVEKDNIEIRFTNFNADLESVANNSSAEFTEIHKFIRFIDGNILLGNIDPIENEDQIMLQIENNKIGFYKNSELIAYWDAVTGYFCSGNLYIRVDEEARFGNFAFKPRNNGSLSFVKVGD